MNLHQAIASLKYKTRIPRRRIDRMATRLVESIAELDRCCEMLCEFSDVTQFGFDDDLDLFSSLDRVLSHLGSSIRSFEEAYEDFSAALSTVYKDVELADSATHLEAQEWARLVTEKSESYRRNLDRFGVSDAYFYVFFHGENKVEVGSISDELAEIVLDAMYVRRNVQALLNLDDPDYPRIYRLLCSIASQFSVHMVRHLNELQKVARWEAGMC